jgi:hypothetical protein
MTIFYASIQYGFENSKDRIVFSFNQSIDSDIWFSTEGIRYDSDESNIAMGPGLRVRTSGGRFSSDVKGMEKVLTPLVELSRAFRDNEEVIFLPQDQLLEPNEEVQEAAVTIGDDDDETSLLKIAHDAEAKTIFVRTQTFGELPQSLERYPNLKQTGPWVPLPEDVVPGAYAVFSAIYETLDTPIERAASLRQLARLVAVKHQGNPDFVASFNAQVEAQISDSSDLEI